MKGTIASSINLAALAIFLGGSVLAVQAQEPAGATDDQSSRIMEKINAAQKSGVLTAKEAQKLREDLADIVHKKTDLAKENNGALPDDQKTKLEADLAKVGGKIEKMQMDKKSGNTGMKESKES